MRRVSSALIQAVECVTIVAVGIAIGFAPVLIGLLIAQGTAVDLVTAWRLGVDAWMLGHGVDIGITLPTEVVVATGLEAAAAPFVLSIAAPGFALLTFVLAFRSGTRLGNAPSSFAAAGGGLAATALLSTLLALSVQSPIAAPNIGHAAVFPTLTMALGLASGFAWHFVDVEQLATKWFAIGAHAAHLVAVSLKTAFGILVAMMGLAGGFLGIVLIAKHADVIVLFEALQPDQFGVVLLWLVQLAVLPLAVVWALSWMLGPGFALGTATHVSPFGTALGPVPTLPLIGTISPEPQPWWLAIVVVPLLGALVIGVLVRRTELAERAAWTDIAIVAVSAAVVVGIALAVLVSLSVGAIGPGRLADTGPDALVVGALGAAVALVGVGLGLAFGAGSVDGDDFDDEDFGDDDAEGHSDARLDTDEDAGDPDATETAVVTPLERKSTNPDA